MSWETKENLSWSESSSEIVWETKESLSLLEKETWVNFFQKASNWIKNLFWIKWNSGETSHSENSNENTPKQDEERQKKTEEKKLQEGFDKEKRTYTNSKSGLTYNCIDQVLDPAGKLKYPGGKNTVASIWCLLASGCTITSALSPSVTLESCFNNVRHWTADKAVPKMSDNKRKSEALLPWEHGKRTKSEEQQAQAKIEKNLEKWYPAIVAVRRNGIDGVNSSVESQHYRAIIDMRVQNGKKEFFVGNTYKNWCWGWLSEDKIFKNMIHASIFTPAQA